MQKCMPCHIGKMPRNDKGPPGELHLNPLKTLAQPNRVSAQGSTQPCGASAQVMQTADPVLQIPLI